MLHSAADGVRPIAPRVSVRWAAAISDQARTAAERRFSLLRGELREGRTWADDLGDLSRANTGALIADPAVEDTHYIDRTAATVWSTAPPARFRSAARSTTCAIPPP